MIINYIKPWINIWMNSSDDVDLNKKN